MSYQTQDKKLTRFSSDRQHQAHFGVFGVRPLLYLIRVLTVVSRGLSPISALHLNIAWSGVPLWFLLLNDQGSETSPLHHPSSCSVWLHTDFQLQRDSLKANKPCCAFSTEPIMLFVTRVLDAVCIIYLFTFLNFNTYKNIYKNVYKCIRIK